MDDPLPDGTRRAIAAQFFTLFGHLSLEDMRTRCGKALSKQTISRDREKVARREVVSNMSARAYSYALERPAGFDSGDMVDMSKFVDAVITARSQFWDQQPVVRHWTSGTIGWQSMMPRIIGRIEARQWTAVIDIIETMRTIQGRDALAESEPYLEFYLGMASRNLGDVSRARGHFRRSFELVRYRDDDPDMKSHAAINYALSLQECATVSSNLDQIAELLNVAIDTAPDDHPATLINVLIAASRLSDQWFGFFGARVRDLIRRRNSELDWAYIRSNIMEHDGLQDYQDNDIVRQVVQAIDERLKRRKAD